MTKEKRASLDFWVSVTAEHNMKYVCYFWLVLVFANLFLEPAKLDHTLTMPRTTASKFRVDNILWNCLGQVAQPWIPHWWCWAHRSAGKAGPASATPAEVWSVRLPSHLVACAFCKCERPFEQVYATAMRVMWQLSTTKNAAYAKKHDSWRWCTIRVLISLLLVLSSLRITEQLMGLWKHGGTHAFSGGRVELIVVNPARRLWF